MGSLALACWQRKCGDDVGIATCTQSRVQVRWEESTAVYVYWLKKVADLVLQQYQDAQVVAEGFQLGAWKAGRVLTRGWDSRSIRPWLDRGCAQTAIIGLRIEDVVAGLWRMRRK